MTTTPRRWPTRTQYTSAVQVPEEHLRGALATARFETGLLGMPVSANGQTAMVFKANLADRTIAIRLFTTSATDGQARYRALTEHLEANPCPSIAPAEWHDEAFVLDGDTYPVVVMDWVEGSQLGVAVEDHLHDGAWLRHLADRWVEECDRLIECHIAHGDLQHGNVLVDPSGEPTFIDLDGIWVPAIADRPPSEFGHPNYQHPDRRDGRTWGQHVDWFSALVIWLSVRALAADASLWRHHSGDNLLFSERDFRGSSQTWQDLASSPDPLVRKMSGVLAEACDADPLAVTTLSELLAAQAPPRGRAGPLLSSTEADGQDEAIEWWRDPAVTGGSEHDQTHRRTKPRAEQAPREDAVTPASTAPRQRAEPTKAKVQADWNATDTSRPTPKQRHAKPKHPRRSQPTPQPIVTSVARSTPPAANPDHAESPNLPGVRVTIRQAEIIDLLAAGMSTDEACRQLGMSPNTMEKHLNKIARAAGVHHRSVIIDRLRPTSTSPNRGGTAPPNNGAAHRSAAHRAGASQEAQSSPPAPKGSASGEPGARGVSGRKTTKGRSGRRADHPGPPIKTPGRLLDTWAPLLEHEERFVARLVVDEGLHHFDKGDLGPCNLLLTDRRLLAVSGKPARWVWRGDLGLIASYDASASHKRGSLLLTAVGVHNRRKVRIVQLRFHSGGWVQAHVGRTHSAEEIDQFLDIMARTAGSGR